MENGEHILLVDDDLDMRNVTCEVFESLNYKVVVADDGRQALTMFMRKPFSIDKLSQTIDILLKLWLGWTFQDFIIK